MVWRRYGKVVKLPNFTYPLSINTVYLKTCELLNLLNIGHFPFPIFVISGKSDFV